MMYLPLSPARFIVLLSGILLLTGCWVQGPRERWEVANQGVYHGSLTENSNHLVLGSIHHGGSFWSTQPLARQFNWNHQSGRFTEILHTAVSTTGKFALTADYHTLTLWNTDNGKAVWYWSAPARIEAIDLSSDGRLALLGLRNNRAVLFDAVNGGVIREFLHNGPVLSVSLSDRAGLALTGSQDLTARLWNITNGSMTQSYSLPNQVTLVKLDKEGTQALLSPANEKAELWDIPSQRRISLLPTSDFRLYRARFQGDSGILLGTTHRRILQFDTSTGRRTGQWQIGSFWQGMRRSTTILDMTWRHDRLWALGSDGYLYLF